MNKLLIIDKKDYKDYYPEIYRESIRAIIFINGKLLLLETNKKTVDFPGGGREANETDYETLAREVKEETGYEVIPNSLKEFGIIEEKRKATIDSMIWHQMNFYYFCKVYPNQNECKYSEEEKGFGYHTIH